MKSCDMAIATTCAVAFLMLAPARPASACDCAVPELEYVYEFVDAVFTGTVVESESPFGHFWVGERISVDRVWKGAIPSVVYMASGTYDADTGSVSFSDCDLRLALDKRYLVFATRTEDGYFSTWLCSGSEDLDGVHPHDRHDELVEVHGNGKPPDGGLATDSRPSPQQTLSLSEDSIPQPMATESKPPILALALAFTVSALMIAGILLRNSAKFSRVSKLR